jgi:hypothetical protein
MVDHVQKQVDDPAYRDRKAGLIFFGIVLILIGAFLLLSVASSVLIGAFTANLQIGDAYRMSPRMIASSASYNLVVAGGAIWLGIGSVLARRWARALTLVFSCIWLVIGVSTLLSLIYLMPRIRERVLVGEDLDSSIMTVVTWIFWIMMGCLFVGLPLVFVLFYGSRRVKQTCDRHDPRCRWTDRCPLPVLALSMVLGFYAICALWSLFYTAPFPVFGTYIIGPPAVLAVLILAAAWGWLALGVYRLRFNAWVGALSLTVIVLLSSILTFTRVDLEEYFNQSSLSTAELDAIRISDLLDEGVMVYWITIPSVALVLYMLLIRRSFGADRDREELQRRG